MTDTSVTPETPNAAETAHFLRRFADMMSVGHNANYLHHAAVWLETLSVQLAAAQDEEQLWRYKYETIAQHTDALEAECEALKHDHDEHLNAVSSALGERDALTSMLQAREAELSELKGQLDHERGERAADIGGTSTGLGRASRHIRFRARDARGGGGTARRRAGPASPATGGTVEGA